MKPIIAMTMGDPGGIGPELILKSLREIKSRKAVYLLIGSREVFEYASKRLKIPLKLHSRIHLLDVTHSASMLYKHNGKFSVGAVSKWNAALSYAALREAAILGANRSIQGLVTAPIHKLAMRLIDPHFSGHTEYLAKTAKAKSYAMMFVSERLRVTLATIHVPIKKVSSVLRSANIVSKIVLTADFLKQRLKIKNPKIGIAALNPHGREFGSEEDAIIAPAIRKAKQKGIHVEGPLPGDQVFFDAYEGRLDAVVAMYHDQGLAPFKMIAFRDGVNVTLGLPYLRTSPDHGTAFDIAYQNKAFHSAFLNSIRLIEKTL